MDINNQIINSENQNVNFMTPEQMKEKLEKINSVFGDYLYSLIENIDENTDNIKDSLKNSSELIQYFNEFCDEFNKISKEIDKNLKNETIINNGNDNNINLFDRDERIIIDNSVVKDINKNIEITNSKISDEIKLGKKKNEDYQEQIKNIVGECHKKYKNIK